MKSARDLVAGLGFVGEVAVAISRPASWPHHSRLAAFVHQLELVALRGVPIVAVISLLVGAVVAQHGVLQLRRSGAVPFVVELVGLLSLPSSACS